MRNRSWYITCSPASATDLYFRKLLELTGDEFQLRAIHGQGSTASSIREMMWDRYDRFISDFSSAVKLQNEKGLRPALKGLTCYFRCYE